MTVDSTYTPDNLSGDGANLIFAYTFRILAEGDVLVQVKDSAGTFTTQVITTDYTVSGVGAQAGGNVTFVVAPSGTDTVVLTRNMSIVQGTDYTENSTFPANSHEEALDELTMIAQQINDDGVRSIRVDASVSGFDGEFKATAQQYLKVSDDGLSLLTVPGDPVSGIQNIVEDTTPQLGGDLDANGKSIKFDDNTGLQDANGNQIITLQTVADAVNEFDISNAATGNGPTIAVTGGNDNIDWNAQVKGTGAYVLKGTADTAAEIRLAEDTSNGTNYMGFKSASSIASSHTYTFPDALPASDKFFQSDSSGNVTFATAGKVLQVLQAVKTDTQTVTAGAMTDIASLSVSITPSSTSSKILIIANVGIGSNDGGAIRAGVQLVRDSTALNVGDAAGSRIQVGTSATGASSTIASASMTFLDSPSTTSATTYKVQAMDINGTIFINRTITDTDSSVFHRGASSIIVMEIGE